LNGKNPRQIAAEILNRRKNRGEFTEILLENFLAGAKISAPDRALCQEIVYGVVRRQATLDWLIAQKTNGRQQNFALQNLLRLGLYQIFWLDKIPPHAAVFEIVELAKQNGFASQAGFVNAILRNYLREFAATKKILAELKLKNPALGFSHPDWLVKKWQKKFGHEKTLQLLEWNNTPPKTFARVNILKTDAGKILEKWRAENVEYDFSGTGILPVKNTLADFSATFENLIFELKSHPPLASLPTFRDGWFYVQDPSTLLAPALLDAQPGETILDLCAAPGGKTTFIAQQINNDGKIFAGDISEDRLKLIRENCTRLGVTCVETFFDPSFFNLHPLFDKILVDASCSNTGVLRRRVDLRWRISLEEILRLAKTQLELLQLAATKLKPGGILIYSTCSLESEENSEVVQNFLSRHKNFQLETQRELLPFDDNVDGAFVARLKKLSE
jgi:16S rRNA (cytosine967-C5)-methyltransferase